MYQVVKISVFVLLSLIFSVYAQECTLPNGQRSTCVRFHYCNHFALVLQKYGGRPPESVEQDIRKHVCPNSRGAVCCPEDSNSIQPPKSLLSPVIDYNALRSHRNFNLVNDRKCGKSASDRIAYGFNATIHEIPWQALLGYTIRNDFKISWGCGGALITNRFVVTAAHCIIKDLKVVRLGEHTISTEKDCDDFDECNDAVQDITVIDRPLRHPSFDRVNKTNDIALIKLSSPADLSRINIKTICLPVEFEDDIDYPRKQFPMTISGFGRLENNEPADTLQKAFVPYLKVDECQNVYTARKATIKFEKQFCAGGKNLTDNCQGDSGGPITNLGSKSRIMLYGVVVGGSGCQSSTALPGVYTDIRYYLNWILENISP